MQEQQRIRKKVLEEELSRQENRR